MKAAQIKSYLLENEGFEYESVTNHELWRIRYHNSTFTYYTNGTLYSSPSVSENVAVSNACDYIDSVFMSLHVLPSKDYLIGLADSGRAEVVGPIFLTGVLIPKNVFPKLDLIMNTSKTDFLTGCKETYEKIEFKCCSEGLLFLIEKISPDEIDSYDYKEIIDIHYHKILSKFFRRVPMDRCRLAIGDYGIGPKLIEFLELLESKGCEVNVENRAKNKFLEIKVSSLISKLKRLELLNELKSNPLFKIEGLDIGSGNAADKKTIDWLKKWQETHHEWPWFIKKSYGPVKHIDGSVSDTKMPLPIDNELLSKTFLHKFKNGQYSVKNISINCPKCGETLKSIIFTTGGTKCISCRDVIDNVMGTLRYYGGVVVPDTNVIRRGILSRDLNQNQFFKDFTFLLSPIVIEECDNSGGKKELGRLSEHASSGLIDLNESNTLSFDIHQLSSTKKDELILKFAINHNSILMTGDNALKARAAGNGLFTIVLK